jgi:solute carrier family 6 amino acid/orphan transporter-like 15/16/17/18/20
MYVYGHKRFTDDIENMTGVRPGPYWQIMWRFVSPALMSAVIASSIYFMLTNNPKYSAWNKELAKSEDREYSHTGLVFAAILAISSLIPIAGGAILHVVRRLQNENYYQSSMIHRVDTNASTHPMMSNFEEFHDLPVGADDSESSDSDSGRRISIEPSMMKKKQPQDFSLEVID